MTKKELLATAKTLNIRGRSKMNKAELNRAIEMTLGAPIDQPEEAIMDSKQMLVSLTQDMNLKFDNGERVNIVEMRAPRDEMDVLFNDPSPHVYSDPLEGEFNELLDHQEVMATIRAEANKLKQGYYDARSVEYKFKMQAEYALCRYLEHKGLFSGLMDKLNRAKERWAALPTESKLKLKKDKDDWKRSFWARVMPIKVRRDEAWTEYNELKGKAKKAIANKKLEWKIFENSGNKELNEELWNKWNEAQQECQEFISSSSSGGRLWSEYFDLIEDEDYLSFFEVDPEDVDDLTILFDEMEQVRCIKDTHLADPFSMPDTYEEEKTEELPVRTYGYVAPVRDVTSEYKAEAELEAQWGELDERFMEMLDEEELTSYA